MNSRKLISTAQSKTYEKKSFSACKDCKTSTDTIQERQSSYNYDKNEDRNNNKTARSSYTLVSKQHFIFPNLFDLSLKNLIYSYIFKKGDVVLVGDVMYCLTATWWCGGDIIDMIVIQSEAQ
jgi:hypothetical protein